MNSKIFRKNSLDRLSNPEQLDQLIQVTSPKGWITFLVVICILAAVVIWSIYGSIQTTVSCSGIILPEDGLHQIYSSHSGVVSKVFVSKGQKIVPGQVVATIQPLNSNAQDQTSTAPRKDNSIEISALQRKIQFLHGKLQAKPRYSDMGFIAQKERETLENSLLKAKEELNNLLQKENQLSQRNKNSEIEIYAPKEGKVIFIEVAEGALVEQAKPILTFSSEKPTRVFGFIDFSAADIEAGMKAQVFPVTVRKEDFGGILAKVQILSDFPSKPSVLYGLLKNQLLVDQFTKNGDPYLIQIEMQRNSDNFSHYEWSIPGGPPQKILDGTVCNIRIVLREDRPITFIVPALKRFFDHS